MPTTAAEACRLALALPEAEEFAHHGRRAFRVKGGRQFATLWDEERLNVMVEEPLARILAQRDPETFTLVPWGGRIAAVAVSLPRVGAPELRDVLAAAHARRAKP